MLCKGASGVNQGTRDKAATARKSSEEALHQHHATLEAALVDMSDAAFITDADGELVDFDDARVE